jgi:hypothetical protein
MTRYSEIKDVYLEFLASRVEYTTQLIRGTPSGLPEFAASKGMSIDARADAILVQQAFWDLVGNGLAMPGDRSRNYQGSELPWISITDYGIACISEGRKLPVDAEGFLDDAGLDQVDDIIRLYFEEAASSFRARNYLAAVAMTGGAMERAILVLTQEYLAKVASGKKSAYKSDVLSQDRIKTRFDKFLNFLDANGIKKSLPRAQQENLDSLFPALVNLIRITRNEVGHPTGREVDRDEAEALIYLLKTGIKFVYEFIN